MFVWVLHRVTGILLIPLLALKLVTAFFLMTKEQKPDWALVLHTNGFLDSVLIVAIVYHAFYGLRTLVLDLGVRRERALFWVFTFLGTVAAGALLAIYFTRNY